MKVLLIGGTGTISTQISKKLIRDGHELYLINRGNRKNALGKGVNYITCDINDEAKVNELLGDMHFDVVADFIAFVKEDLERDYRLFKDRTKQFMFISSASAYQKPLADYKITESTPTSNPFWQYSRDKIEGEKYLNTLYREQGFPVTIIRPSHTYDDRTLPLGVQGEGDSWQVAKRMLAGKRVIIQGDGTSLWTMTSSKDFAVAFVGLMGNIHAIGETVQITSDETLTWNQIYNIIADALGVELKAIYMPSTFLSNCGKYDFLGELIGDKANSVVFDNSKVKRLVPEFVASTRFDQGIKETINNILAHPEYQHEDLEFDAWCDKMIKIFDEALEKAKKLS